MNTKVFIQALFLIPVMGICLSGCSSSGEAGSEATNEGDEKTEAIRVMEIETIEISRRVAYTAHLQASREVHLASSTPGRIHSILVEPGDRVKEGQVVVEMDNTQLQQALLQLESLEKDYHRLDTLRKVGSVSQQQFDQVRTQYDLARSNVAFLRENTRMLAPFSGMVSGKYYENGEMFSGAPNTAAGKAAIISLVQISQLKAVVNVAERYYPYIKAGMDVSIQPDLYADDVFSGRVMTVYPVIDPLSRTFKIEISIPNREEKLRPGMFARAILEFDQVEAFVVPSLAILKLQGSNERYVFLEEDGVAKRVVVEIGDRYDDMVELIADDIQEGDRLIIAGQSRLLDGMAVDVVR